MTPRSPAIVAQAAVARLPRWALLLFCLAYALPGFIGRDAWLGADMTGLGFMAELAQGRADWMHPTLMGTASENPALLPYWIGAVVLKICPSWLPADFVVRIPFVCFLLLCMLSTWWGTYYLARSDNAQPVSFAFGGEAAPKDYARAIADGGLLALIACLGLAQLSHETTPAVAQLGFVGLGFYGFAVLPYRPWFACGAASLGVIGLSLCGAPTIACLFGAGALGIYLVQSYTHNHPSKAQRQGGFSTQHQLHHPLHRRWHYVVLAAAIALALLLSHHYGLLLWKIELPEPTIAAWAGVGELLLWFTWPAWPLALWALWRWRAQILSRQISCHVAIPLWWVLVVVAATIASATSDRTLLLALPPLAALAAFALPTFKRQVSALIDWFTLLFFSGWGLVFWVMWLSMQTGVPHQPAANVARLVPGFVASFSGLSFAIAVVATVAWGWLVRWRVGRHRSAIWKSLILPAAGVAWCWVLMMTLWLPLFNYARSYNAMVAQSVAQMQPTGCIETIGLEQAKIAAFSFYGKRNLQPAQDSPSCPWLLVEAATLEANPQRVNTQQWEMLATVAHPAIHSETVVIYKRH